MQQCQAPGSTHCSHNVWCINPEFDAQSPCSNKEHTPNIVKTLTQACPQECPKGASAFNGQLIHGILQFTMIIALCCTLHQHVNQDICCWKCVVRWITYLSTIAQTALLSTQWLLHPIRHSSQLSTGMTPAPQPTITIGVWSHEWSFRRFTYGNLVTTSPSSKW